MGLFSSKKKTYVASTIYNLAGDMSQRTKYLSSVSVHAVLKGANVAQTVKDGLSYGPNNSQIMFYKWGNRNFKSYYPSADLVSNDLKNPAVLAPHVPGLPGYSAWVIDAQTGPADAQVWAEQWLAINHPHILEREWSADIDDVTKIVTIAVDNTVQYTFLASGFNRNADYVYARYTLSMPGSNGLVIPKEDKTFKSLDGINLDGFTKTGESLVPTVNVSLKTTVAVQTNDAAPVETVTNRSLPFEGKIWNYQKDQYKGKYGSSLQTYSIRKKITITAKHQIVRDVQQTVELINGDRVTTTTTTEQLVTVYERQLTEQEILHKIFEPMRIFIYRIGSGIPELDNLRQVTATAKEFFPAIPLRIDNKFIDHDDFTSKFPLIKKAYKKAMSSDIEDMLDQLKDNDKIGDLDFIFLHFGVLFNERDRSGKRYIYHFLRTLGGVQKTSKEERLAYQGLRDDQVKVQSIWDRWNRNLENGAKDENQEEPARPVYPVPELSSLLLTMNDPLLGDFKIFYRWTYIDEQFLSGKGKPGAKVGDVWWEKGSNVPSLNTTNRFINEDGFLQNLSLKTNGDENERLYLFWQTDRFTFRRLEIVGLVQENFIYANKSVYTTAHDALDADDESEFFFPLHYPSLKELSLVDQNQLATVNKLLVINTYKTVKIRWYQRGIFKFIFVIAVVVVSVLMMNPAVAAATPGLLGTNMLVGQALGLSGMAAVAAGAAANAIAAMILTTIITKVSTEVLGEKWGAVIGTIISFVAMQYGTQFATTGNFNVDWGRLMRADNLIKLTDTMGKAYQSYLQGDMAEMMQDYESLRERYMDQLQEVQDLTADLLGNGGSIDPTLLTDLASNSFNSLRESSDSYLNRTLMTGTDIAQLTHNLITQFTDQSLSLPKAFN